ncbi:MAG: hypothetical protein ACHQFZ_09715 [Acidimicrobiales bacterium]
MTPDAYLVPLKAFDRAKERLRAGAGLDVPALARRLAGEVLLACAPVPVIVVTESLDVAAFAGRFGADVCFSQAGDLNEALQRAYDALGGRYARLAVVPGDLRYPAGLGSFDPADGVTVVTDRHGSGTNVLALPGAVGFHFRYGDDSARHHADEARRLGLAVHLIERSTWSIDVDRPEDLEVPPDSV